MNDMNTTRGILKNVDCYKGMDDLINEEGSCLFKSVFLRDTRDLEIEGGTVFRFSNKYKKWAPCWDFHFWNIDDNGEIYDSVNLLNKAPQLIGENFRKITTGKYFLLDAYDMGYDGTNKTGLPTMKKIIHWSSKYIPKDKYDFIYVIGLASYRGEIFYNEEELYALLDLEQDPRDCSWTTRMIEKLQRQKTLFNI